MNIPRHVAVNIFASIPLKYFLGWDWMLISIFIIAGIAIDIDHVFFFMFKHHKIKLKKWIAIAKEMKNKRQAELYIFHSPEFNAILLLLSFFSQAILAVFISNLIHILIDGLDHYQYHRNLLDLKKWSILYLLKNKFSCLASYYRSLHSLVRRSLQNSD